MRDGLSVLGVRVRGPLEGYAAGFAEFLLGQGYAPGSAHLQVHLVAQLSRWLEAEGLDAAGLTELAAERFIAARRARVARLFRSRRALEPVIGYLRELGVVPAPEVVELSPVDALLERYRRYLLFERVLTVGTTQVYVTALRPFVASFQVGERLELQRITAAEVSRFVLAEATRREGTSIRSVATALRSLLGFLHVEGAVERSLTGAVPGVGAWRAAGLPQPLERGQLRRLLDSCDRRTAIGRRDFAIVLMMGRLGLRCGEIARLTLDDIGWHAGEILIYGKAARDERLPLPADVGSALDAYLRRGRPANALDRAVFVRSLAPHRAMGSGAITRVVAAAAERAGLGTVRAHRLRHTAATELLRAGASLPEVGQVLRHRRLLSTAIYAKVDEDALRPLARPWPTERGRSWSSLHQTAEDYLRIRRALGFKLENAGRLLPQFLDYLESAGADTITTEHAVRWATLPSDANPVWWCVRLTAVRGFARYLQSLDPDAELPPSGVLPTAAGGRRPNPYVYSEAQIVALMDAAGSWRPRLSAATMQTLIGLLAVTGMRIGEAIRLDRTDLDLDHQRLVVHKSKFGKSRQLPLHPTTTRALRAYLHNRDELRPNVQTPALLITATGKRLNRDNVERQFRQLRKQTGLTARPGSRPPRIHDIRHTFAVHTMLDSYRNGKDPAAQLAQLATYLGHADPAASYWYLSAAPDLLSLAAARLERHLTEVSR